MKGISPGRVRAGTSWQDNLQKGSRAAPSVTGYAGYMPRAYELEVPDPERRFHRLSGRLSLDLVATVGERWRRRFERLRTPGDLDRWFHAVGRVTTAASTHADLRAARELRGAIELVALASAAGRRLPPGAVATLNEFAATPDAAPQLVGGKATVAPPNATAVLSSVARDAVDLFGGPFAGRVRECDAEDCALLFVDTSRAATRRWCSMRGCGNRSKVARHRRNQNPDAARVNGAQGG